MNTNPYTGPSMPMHREAAGKWKVGKCSCSRTQPCHQPWVARSPDGRAYSMSTWTLAIQFARDRSMT